MHFIKELYFVLIYLQDIVLEVLLFAQIINQFKYKAYRTALEQVCLLLTSWKTQTFSVFFLLNSHKP